MPEKTVHGWATLVHCFTCGKDRLAAVRVARTPNRHEEIRGQPFPISLASRCSPLRPNTRPGAASVPHTHANSAFIYACVISGAIKSKVNDSETRICRRASFTTRIAKDEHQVYRMELEFDLAVVSSA
jgi:hypothetical protein